MVWWVVAAVAAKSVLNSGGQIDGNIETIKAQRTALAKGISELNLERSQSRRRTNDALFNAQQSKNQALSQVGLQASASDTIGASLSDAVSTVNINADRQEAGIRYNQQVQEQAFFNKATKLVDDAEANTPSESGADILFNSLLGGFGGAAGSAAAGAATNNSGSSYEAGSATGYLNSSNGSGGPTQPHDYGYSSWGSRAETTFQSWKSYLGGSS